MIGFVAGNVGQQMGGWFANPIASSQDVVDLKIRIPALGATIYARAGAQVQQVPGNQIKEFLGNGMLDATDWVGPYEDEKMGFHEVVQNYYQPGWHEPSTPLALYMNLNVYNSLPDDLRGAIERAAARTTEWSLADTQAKNQEALTRLLAAGVQVQDFPQAVLDTMEAHMEAFHADEQAANPDYATIYDSWNAYRQ
jgi:TRAP-type mannitol/chloroaromatic compound transport system substrate-binding protein